MPRIRLTTMIAALLAVAPAKAGSIDMKPGLWEVTTQMEGPGLPPGLGRMTVRQCFTEKDVGSPETMADDPAGDARCSVDESVSHGPSYRFRMNCEGMTMTGEGRYFGDSYEMTTIMDMEGEGRMITRASGRRLGDCR